MRPGLPDGMAVDRQGHIWATGPGGVLVFTPDGQLLGRLNTGQRTANCTFGADGKTLFITADSYVCRVKTLVPGVGY
jgi:gluconolactonase